jgi:hypothetical protein
MKKDEAQQRFDKFRPKVIKLLDEGFGCFQIGKKIGVSHSTVQGWIEKINGGKPVDSASHTAKPPPVGSRFSQAGKNVAMASLTDTKIRTLEDLIEACSVNMEIWEVVSFDCKCWEMGRKAKKTDITWVQGVATGNTKDTGKIFVQPLFSVVAKFKRRKEKTSEELAEHFKGLLADIKPTVWKNKPLYVDAQNTLELMIPDLHIGQYSWAESTRGDDYNVEIACDLLKKAVRDMVSEAGPRIKRIAFPVGNDFFNIDNLNKTTRKGTPQDEDGSWQRSFRIGSRALIELIGELSTRYEVDVMVVPGNHDFQRAFYLGEVLAAYFHDNDRVEIDNTAHSRKYRLYGCTLVGYTHGDQERVKDLPMLMAHQEPTLWSKSIYREWHHGHVHHERNNEVGGIKLRHFPALVAPDDWHSKKGYVMSVRQACAIEYSDDGPIRQYNWYPAMAKRDRDGNTK